MRYFIGLIVTILLVITLIVLLFSGGGKSKTPVAQKSLSSYASTDAQVRFVVGGPIVANSQHQGYQITVDNTEATYQQFQGYDGDIVNSQSYSNTENSYYAFLRALAQAGFLAGNDKLTTLPNNIGICPLGDRYNFQIIENGQNIQDFWSTNCGTGGTFEGEISLIQQLFQAQIPDFSTLTQNVSL